MTIVGEITPIVQPIIPAGCSVGELAVSLGKNEIEALHRAADDLLKIKNRTVKMACFEAEEHALSAWRVSCAGSQVPTTMFFPMLL